ncbi:hypothetical protein CEXT_511571 [Caerostris extrusa]|uniref:Uncharacterized protein n=1 Tax=Caerostris extrusa TaxID=172846 RepID=A0AAV4XC02_CAEEX|nr:hypothetical protein CEXT_511571 [Caerostris extrusa]
MNSSIRPGGLQCNNGTPRSVFFPRPFTIVTTSIHAVPAIALATADLSWGFEISVTTSSLTSALLEEQQLGTPPKSCMAIHTKLPPTFTGTRQCVLADCSATMAYPEVSSPRPFTIVITSIHAVPAIGLATADLSWGFEISVTTSSLTSALLEEQQLAPLPPPKAAWPSIRTRQWDLQIAVQQWHTQKFFSTRSFTIVITSIHAVPAIALATADLSWGFEISVTIHRSLLHCWRLQQLAPSHLKAAWPSIRKRSCNNCF